MSRQLMLLASLFSALLISSCNDDDKPKTLPVVTTAAITDVGAHTASGGGEITDNGNATILAAGLCYGTSENPTVENDTTLVMLADNVFTSNLDELASGTAYYVRAYAINSVGISYGEQRSFTTGNTAPMATEVMVANTLEVFASAKASYVYSDDEGDEEAGTTFQWYVADDEAGANAQAISGATDSVYYILATDESKYLSVSVTVQAATGTVDGVEVRSAFAGPVAATEKITFTYNGASVTYGVLVSSVTGRKWMDRNLGAAKRPSSYNDWANYGDLFQWGRGADGHQRVVRTGPDNADASLVNGTTNVLATTDTPGNQFIIPSSLPWDWQSSQSANRWQGSENVVNNPCPSGWHIPTQDEWKAENATQGINSLSKAFAQLKVTMTGRISFLDGSFASSTSSGFYWASTTTDRTSTVDANYHFFAGEFYYVDPNERDNSLTFRISGEYIAYGFACRCIKNEN